MRSLTYYSFNIIQMEVHRMHFNNTDFKNKLSEIPENVITCSHAMV